jgi:hypothetical protein
MPGPAPEVVELAQLVATAAAVARFRTFDPRAAERFAGHFLRRWRPLIGSSGAWQFRCQAEGRCGEPIVVRMVPGVSTVHMGTVRGPADWAWDHGAESRPSAPAGSFLDMERRAFAR